MPDATGEAGVHMTNNDSISGLRRVLPPLVCAITAAMAVAVWVDSTGNPNAYFSATVPPGQTLYVFSKLAALLGIVMLWFQAMAALAKVTPVLRGFPILRGRLHVLFGVATFVIILMHLALFVTASTIRTKHAALDLLLPTFSHGYYRTMVGIGAIAFWALVLAVFAGWRRLRGGRFAHWLHRLVFAVFTLAFVHGLTVGSETRFGLMKYVYAFIALSLGTAVLSRGWHLLRRPKRTLAAPSGAVLTATTPGSDRP